MLVLATFREGCKKSGGHPRLAPGRHYNIGLLLFGGIFLWRIYLSRYLLIECIECKCECGWVEFVLEAAHKIFLICCSTPSSDVVLRCLYRSWLLLGNVLVLLFI